MWQIKRESRSDGILFLPRFDLIIAPDMLLIKLIVTEKMMNVWKFRIIKST